MLVLRIPLVLRILLMRHADAPLTPYELYIKLLNYKFGNIIDIDQQRLIESYLPESYNPLDYQQMTGLRKCDI